MRDRSKQLLVINTGKKESTQTSAPVQSGTTHIIGGGVSVNMGDYLLKSIWDKVWEIRTDSQGIEYIFGKLPMVTQYGITMYSGDGVNVPSLASGLPFDGRTIWYNPDTQQIEVIGGTGGGSGEGVSNFWDLSGIPSWITNSKPKYSYSEIEGTPDLSKYALASQIPSLSGYATELWVTKQNYATKATTLSGYGITDAYTKTNVDDLLKSYVTLSGSQTITGEKNFTGGLKVNGSPIYYDTEKKYWKFEGDLLVTGGVTMYGSDSSFTPSTIMDALLYDDTTLGINSNGQLYVKGGTSGGGLDITALQNYLTSNSYLNVTSGDNRYLRLSGGTLSSNSRSPLTLKSGSSENHSLLLFNRGSDYWGSIGFNAANSLIFKDTNGANYTIWHSGNDGSGSGLDADLLDGQEGSWYQNHVHSFDIVNISALYGAGASTNVNTLRYGMLYNYGSADYWVNAPAGMSFGQILNLKNSNTYDLAGQLAWDINHGSTTDTTRYLWWRASDDGSFTEAKWHQIAFTDSNVASATKLQTARTIWGQSFDGTQNIIGGFISDTTKDKYRCTYNIYYQAAEYYASNLSSGDQIGINFGKSYAAKQLAYIGYKQGSTDNESRLVLGLHSVDDVFNLTASGNVGIGTPNPNAKLHIVNNTNTSTGLRLDGGWSGYGFLYNAINIFLNGEQYGGIGVNTVSSAYGSTAAAGTYITNAKSGEYMNFYNEGGTFLKSSLLVNGGITMYSDQRKKTILNHVELSLKQIANAPLVEHYYNSDEKKTTHVGSIAQYWANMNDWFCKLDSEGFYTMEIQNAALASAISIARELDRYETKTDKAIKKLKKRICELEEEVEQLRNRA